MALRGIPMTDVHRHEYTLSRTDSAFPIVKRYHHPPAGESHILEHGEPATCNPQGPWTVLELALEPCRHHGPVAELLVL